MFPIIFADKPKKWKPSALPNLLYWYDISQPGSLSVDSAVNLDGTNDYLSVADTLGKLDAVSFGFGIAVKLTQVGAGVDQTIVTDGEPSATPYGANSYNFRLWYDHSESKFTLDFQGYGASTVSVAASSTSAYGSTHFIVFHRDLANQTVGIAVNGGAFATTALATFVGSGRTAAEELRFGANLNTTPAEFAKGVLDEAWMGNSVPSSTDVSQTYNGGTGARLEQFGGFVTPFSVTLTHSYKFNENGDTAFATRNDNVGSLHLTANGGTLNSVTGLANPTAVNNGDPVNTINDLSGNARHLTQSDSTKRALYKTNIQNGKPGLLFDQTNDYYSMANAWTLSSIGAVTTYSVFKFKTGAANKNIMSGTTNSFAFGSDSSATAHFRYLEVGVANIGVTSSAPGSSAALRVTNAYTDGAGSGVLRVSGASNHSFTGAQSCTNPTNTVGATSTPSVFFGDYIFELFGYSVQHTAFDQPETYMKVKWNVA